MQWTPSQIRLFRTAGLCLAQERFAAVLGFAKRTIGNVERGTHPPSLAVRRALDQVFHQASDAQRTRFLAALKAEAADQHRPPNRIDPALGANPDEFERFRAALANPRRTDLAVVNHLHRVLAEQRRAEDTSGARLLLGPALAQIHVIDILIRQARSPVRTALLEVAAHFAEFAGWMCQDATDAAKALRHYDVAMEAAQEIGDTDMITSVLSLKSHLAWTSNDATRAIGLAVAGQREPQRISEAVLALSAQQEARGHALDGNADATERALDRATAWTYSAAEHPEDAPPWVYFQSPKRLAFQRGVAYVELGDHTKAIPLLSTALAGLPESYRRDQARYGAQLALALAGAGDADGALSVATDAAELTATTGSALATRELRRVHTALRDRGADAQARALTEHVRTLTDEFN